MMPTPTAAEPPTATGVLSVPAGTLPSDPFVARWWLLLGNLSLQGVRL